MDPPENHPIKNDPHNPDDPENRRSDIDDSDEGDDDEGEDEESLDTFSSQPLTPLVAASTGQGQETTAGSFELPHKVLKPSPLKAQPQGQLQGTRGDRPLTTSTFTTSSSSGTSSSTPHTASALSGTCRGGRSSSPGCFGSDATYVPAADVDNARYLASTPSGHRRTTRTEVERR